MNNKIQISKLDSLSEEKTYFRVNNQELIGFNVSSQELEIGKEYEAEIDIFMNDYLDIQEQKTGKIKRIEYINNYSYDLWGKLVDENTLDVGFFISSDLFEDYQYLVGKYVSLKIDRLQIYCE